MKFKKNRLLLTVFIVALGVALVGIANAATINDAQMTVDEMNAVMQDTMGTSVENASASTDNNDADTNAANEDEATAVENDENNTNDDNDEATNKEKDPTTNDNATGFTMGQQQMMTDPELQQQMQNAYQNNSMDVQAMNDVHQENVKYMNEVHDSMQQQMVQTYDDMNRQMKAVHSGNSGSGMGSMGGGMGR